MTIRRLALAAALLAAIYAVGTRSSRLGVDGPQSALFMMSHGGRR